MKKASNRTRAPGLRPEYSFDYGKSRPNRFAGRIRGDDQAAVLDADVASKRRNRATRRKA